MKIKWLQFRYVIRRNWHNLRDKLSWRFYEWLSDVAQAVLDWRVENAYYRFAQRESEQYDWRAPR